MGRARHYAIELTSRQREVLRLVGRGHTNTEIAGTLGISLAGAKWHVSELLQKFGVDSREDLAERWREESGVGAKAGRLWAGLLGALPLKPSAALVAGSLAVTATVVGVGAAYSAGAFGNADEPVHAVAAQATETPTSMPTPIPTPTLPAAPGAIWTADEALRRAEALARVNLAGNLNHTIEVGSFQMTRAEWKPGVTHLEGGDDRGDRYWDSQGGLPVDIWLFEFTSPDAVISGASPLNPGIVTVEVVLTDGVIDDEPTAVQTSFRDPATGQIVGGGAGNWQSRQTNKALERHMREMAAQGPSLGFGRHNDQVNGPPIEAYLSEAGYWCVVGRNSEGTPGVGPECPQWNGDARAVSARSQTLFKDGGMGDMFLFVNSLPEIVSLKVLPGDGRELTFATYAPPPQSGITRRFAWLNIGQVSSEGYTLIGYDAAGNEVGREGREKPGPPPPPPPRD